jgi:hypothetical protein
MIDFNRRLLFIHIARTGGTSIEYAFAGNDWCCIDMPTKHLSPSQARKHYGEDVWNSFVKFTVVRNPWDRLVSMWVTGSWHFALDYYHPCDREFLAQLRPHPNEKYQSLHYHEILDDQLDYVLRFENLQADLARMLSERGLAPVTLPRVEATCRGHYSDYYSPEAADMVGSMFRQDIDRYGYKFESAPAAWAGEGGRMPLLSARL